MGACQDTHFADENVTHAAPCFAINICCVRIVRLQAFVVVGDSNGHVGLGVKCAKEVRRAELQGLPLHCVCVPQNTYFPRFPTAGQHERSSVLTQHGCCLGAGCTLLPCSCPHAQCALARASCMMATAATSVGPCLPRFEVVAPARMPVLGRAAGGAVLVKAVVAWCLCIVVYQQSCTCCLCAGCHCYPWCHHPGQDERHSRASWILG